MIPKEYIKGLAISRPKIAEFFELEPNSPMESAIHETIRWLDRDAFMFIACGLKPDGTRRLVIVLDRDDDEDVLRGRPSKPFGPSLNAALPVLDGPDIWERTA
jgi:hypothetical protein